MIKSSFLRKQAKKYRELAKAEDSLDIRRRLFGLAATCEGLVATIERAPVAKRRDGQEKPADGAQGRGGVEPLPTKRRTAASVPPDAASPYVDQARPRIVHRLQG